MAKPDVFKTAKGEKTEYVFIESKKMTHFALPNRRGFDSAVSFWEGPRGFSMNYPVVFDDHTMSDGRVLERIAYEDVPAAIKAKHTKWKRLQG